MRGREFIMKDAYSFHADEQDSGVATARWILRTGAF